MQILDPATGTGTFLAEVIHAIHDKMKGQQGLWQSYVEKHLLPRLNGFELLMASYAMAHLKLDMVLAETGYEANNSQRLRVYLTNSLEEHHADTGTLFANALSNEANQANHIKRDAPVMVVIGNPPYSGVSSNNGAWITRLIDDYKYVNGVHFNERKHWLNDDYVKFIRLGQAFVDKNTEGVLAYINNHSFLDNPTFRGMRWNLMQSFDKIYIIDLHGNSKKKEVCPDGSKDENVFDIQQGVSINIFIKKGKKRKGKLAEVYHCDLYGKRQDKYNLLTEYSFGNTDFKRIEPNEPFYFFVPRDESNRTTYEQGVCINDIFPLNTSGIVSMGDTFAIADTKEELLYRLEHLLDTDYTAKGLTAEYNLGKNYADFILNSKKSLHIDTSSIVRYNYRPFDIRYTYFDNKVLWRPREKVMHHFTIGDNVGIVVGRQCVSDWRYAFITNKICEFNLTGTAGRFGSGYVFPLYLYDAQDGKSRRPNLDMEIVGQIAEKIGLQFEEEKSGNIEAFCPMDLLDYIYGILHSPSYREQFKEFLKVDFPRIPYPTDANEFHRVAEIGGELRRVHLMEASLPLVTEFNVAGSNTIEAIKITEGGDGLCKVWINDKQYFDNVPRVAWEFYIGGYQPAQKWLKDRKGMTLEWDDVMHYQRIISALCKTNELMSKIDD